MIHRNGIHAGWYLNAVENENPLHAINIFCASFTSIVVVRLVSPSPSPIVVLMAIECTSSCMSVSVTVCAYNSCNTLPLPLSLPLIQLHLYQGLSHSDKISSIDVVAVARTCCEVGFSSLFFIASVTESRIIFSAQTHGKHVICA